MNPDAEKSELAMSGSDAADRQGVLSIGMVSQCQERQ